MIQQPLSNDPQEQVILVNIVEELVKEQVHEQFKKFDMCTCEKCFLSACAIALNSLKPQYVTTTKGALLAQINSFDKSYQIQIMVETTRAIMIVKNSPRH